MEKIYVIYEVREEDYKIINNLQLNYDIIKVFKDESNAKMYLKNELDFQCNNEEDWEYKIEENEDTITANVYYNGDWQYCLGLKAMKIEE